VGKKDFHTVADSLGDIIAMDRVEGKTSCSKKAARSKLLRKKKMAIHINLVQAGCNRPKREGFVDPQFRLLSVGSIG
jgi:hypothetical protein